MGCMCSTLDQEEIVQKCKERKKLMKHLASFRAEFAAAQMFYLQALRNTGVTLRQFTEGDYLDFESAPYGLKLPPPPPPLPPSPPPPPPPFSPDVRRDFRDPHKEKPDQDECTEIDDDNRSIRPPSSVHSSQWEFWDPFAQSTSPITCKKIGEDLKEVEEDEDWAEAKTEFEEELEDEGEVAIASRLPPKKTPTREPMDDNSSTLSWSTKDTSEMTMVLWRSKKTLANIVKELDEYFLKASEGAKEIGVLLDANHSNHVPLNYAETKNMRFKSAKVFSALSWTWSSKSLNSSINGFEVNGVNGASKIGALCRTLEKLYAEEQRLYVEVKEEESAKLQLGKKIALLQKQETCEQDSLKVANTRSSIETLQSEILCIQESISRTCMSIWKLRDEELYPELLDLSSGLMQMWRTMYECHQVQNHIAQQMNHLRNHSSTEPTKDYHRQAALQFEVEVTSWYNTFCNLISSQREFIGALNQWLRLTTDILPTNSQPFASEICRHCEEWKLAIERLPDKVASEAIKSFISVIHSIVVQLADEHNLQKKSTRLERRLEKQLMLLSKLEGKSQEALNGSESALSDSLLPEHEKINVLRKKVEEERVKFLNSVRISRAMMLNNLQTGLPNVFQAMMGFSNVCAQAYEAIHGYGS